MVVAPHLQHTHIRDILQKHFTRQERLNLCQDLGILHLFENEEKEGSPREIVAYYGRTGTELYLTRRIYELRQSVVLDCLLTNQTAYGITESDLDSYFEQFGEPFPKHISKQKLILNRISSKDHVPMIGRWLEAQRPDLFAPATVVDPTILGQTVPQKQQATENAAGGFTITGRTILDTKLWNVTQTLKNTVQKDNRGLMMISGFLSIAIIVLIAMQFIEPESPETPPAIASPSPTNTNTPIPSASSTPTPTTLPSNTPIPTNPPVVISANNNLVLSVIANTEDGPTGVRAQVAVLVNNAPIRTVLTQANGKLNFSNFFEVPTVTYQLEVVAEQYQSVTIEYLGGQPPDPSIQLDPLPADAPTRPPFPTATPTQEVEQVILLTNPPEGVHIPNATINFRWTSENVEEYQLLLRKATLADAACDDVYQSALQAKTSEVTIEPICAGEWLWRVVSADGQVSSEWRSFWYAPPTPTVTPLPSATNTPTPSPTTTPRPPTMTPTATVVAQICTEITAREPVSNELLFELQIQPPTSDSFEIILTYKGIQPNCPATLSSNALTASLDGFVTWQESDVIPPGCFGGWAWELVDQSRSTIATCNGEFLFNPFVVASPTPDDPEQ